MNVIISPNSGIGVQVSPLYEQINVYPSLKTIVEVSPIYETVTVNNSSFPNSNLISFKYNPTSGNYSDFIYYPYILTNLPKSVGITFENEVDSYIYGYSISGVNNSGFNINYTNMILSSEYILNIMVAI